MPFLSQLAVLALPQAFQRGDHLPHDQEEVRACRWLWPELLQSGPTGLPPLSHPNPLDAEATVFLVLIGAYGLFLILDIVATALVYVPRNPRTGKSLIYFEDIGAMSMSSPQPSPNTLLY